MNQHHHQHKRDHKSRHHKSFATVPNSQGGHGGRPPSILAQFWQPRLQTQDRKHPQDETPAGLVDKDDDAIVDNY